MTETPDSYRPNVDGSDAPAPTSSSPRRAPSAKAASASAPTGAAFGPAATAATEAADDPTPTAGRTINRSLIVPVAAALVIGAILGGAAGAGVAVIVSGANNSNGITSTHAGVVVNDTSHVTSITGVVAKAEPSVVTLSVTGGSSSGTGSGVILSSDGYVLTNNHVATLDGATAKPTIKVQDSVGHIYDATLVGTDPTVDLAVVKLQGASGLTPIEWGDSSKLNVGDTAIAMGAPLGLAGTVTTGIVSALNRSIQIASSAVPDSSAQDSQGQFGSPFNFDLGNGSQAQTAQASISIPVVQTDAAINPGNSGGALLDANGRLIGINVAIASAGSSSGGQSGSIGVGFALPANLAKRVSDELITSGKASHGMLGASVSDAAAAKSSKQVGALLRKVTSGSAAAKAGLSAGDIIIDFSGIPIADASDLTAAVRTFAAGTKVQVTYLRGGSEKTVTVTLDALTVK
jgi:putative serine protease PepD